MMTFMSFHTLNFIILLEHEDSYNDTSVVLGETLTQRNMNLLCCVISFKALTTQVSQYTLSTDSKTEPPLLHLELYNPQRC